MRKCGKFEERTPAPTETGQRYYHMANSLGPRAKVNAKFAGEKSEELFLALFVKECGPLEDMQGLVVNVLDHSVDVLILDVATTKRYKNMYSTCTLSLKYSR